MYVKCCSDLPLKFCLVTQNIRFYYFLFRYSDIRHPYCTPWYISHSVTKKFFYCFTNWCKAVHNLKRQDKNENTLYTLPSETKMLFFWCIIEQTDIVGCVVFCVNCIRVGCLGIYVHLSDNRVLPGIFWDFLGFLAFFSKRCTVFFQSNWVTPRYST